MPGIRFRTRAACRLPILKGGMAVLVDVSVTILLQYQDVTS